MTIAQQVSARFYNDTAHWETANGLTIHDACLNASALVNQLWRSEATRYVFSDDSAIVVSGSGWDVARYPGDINCCCWSGANVDSPECEVHGYVV